MASPTTFENMPMVSSGTESKVEPEWTPDLDPDDLRELQEAERDPTKVVSKLPSEAARLGYFSTLCLIFNRMIGRFCPACRAQPSSLRPVMASF